MRVRYTCMQTQAPAAGLLALQSVLTLGPTLAYCSCLTSSNPRLLSLYACHARSKSLAQILPDVPKQLDWLVAKGLAGPKACSTAAMDQLRKQAVAGQVRSGRGQLGGINPKP